MLFIQQQSPPLSLTFLTFGLIFAVFYFLLILPYKRRQKQLQKLASNIKSGDRVITSGGLCGTVASVKDDTVVLRSGQVNIEVTRSSVVTVVEPKEVKGA